MAMRLPPCYMPQNSSLFSNILLDYISRQMCFLFSSCSRIVQTPRQCVEVDDAKNLGADQRCPVFYRAASRFATKRISLYLLQTETAWRYHTFPEKSLPGTNG